MALVIALGAIGGFGLRYALDDTSSSRRPQRTAPDPAPSDFQSSAATPRSDAAPAPRAPTDAAPAPRAPTDAAPAPRTPTDAAPAPRTPTDAGAPRPVDRSAQPLLPAVDAATAITVDVNAPTQVANGEVFDVSVGLSGSAQTQSARFRVTYDATSLDVVEIVDASGTALSVVPEGGTSVVLEMDASQAPRAPVVRFTARVDQPHTIDLVVAAEAWDANGTALAVRASGSHPIMLVP